MKRRNLIAVLTCSFFILAIVVSLISSGLSQSTEAVKSAIDNKIDSAKEARRAAMIAYDSIKGDTITGWLILDGELIEGPYSIVVDDDCIKINGIRTFKGAKNWEYPDDGIIDSAVAGDHGFIETFSDSFHVWNKNLGTDSAHDLALRFMSTQTIVDSAYFVSPYDVRVFLRGRSWPHAIWLHPRDETLPSHADVRKNNLYQQAKLLTGWLEQGSLVIIDSGRLYTIPPPKAATVVLRLKEIVASTGDIASREAAINDIIHDKEMAEKIAKSFAK